MKSSRENHHNNSSKNLKLARAYVTSQAYCDTFPLDEALLKGVLFTNLYTSYEEATMENITFKEDCYE